MNHCRTKLGKTFESVQKKFYSKKGNYLIHKNVAVRIFTRPKTQRWGFNSLENDYESGEKKADSIYIHKIALRFFSLA